MEPLITAVPTASVYPRWYFPNSNGLFTAYAARWLVFVQGHASQGSLFRDSDYWESRYMEMHRGGRAFEDSDEITGVSSRVFDRWIQHPHMVDYWRVPAPDSADYARLGRPILTGTGHFDGDQPGALRYYRKHMQYGSTAETEQHYLLIGPWSHGGTRDPESELGGLTFADTTALVEPGQVERHRFDRFFWFPRRLQEGSRIRLVVAPLNTPDAQKKYNSGGDSGQETVEDARTATVRLHLSENWPSALVLPVRSTSR